MYLIESPTIFGLSIFNRGSRAVFGIFSLAQYPANKKPCIIEFYFASSTLHFIAAGKTGSRVELKGKYDRINIHKVEL